MQSQGPSIEPPPSPVLVLLFGVGMMHVRPKLFFGSGCGCCGTLSVEPAALLLMTSILMSHLVFTNFLMERICRGDLALGPTLCDAIHNLNGSYHEEELEIQLEVARLRSYRSLIQNSLPLLPLLFLGAWSDQGSGGDRRRRRMIPMLLSISTVLLQDILMVGCALVEEVGGLWVSLLVAIPPCLTGGGATFTMASYSHISDSTSPASRTLRIGLLSASSQLGVPLGFALGGALLKADLGYPLAFSISASLSLLAFLNVLHVMGGKDEQEEDAGGAAAKEVEEGSVLGVWSTLVATTNGLLDVVLRKREQRGLLLLLLLVYLCVAIPIHGEYGLMYLYLRAKLGWDVGLYSLFSIYNYAVSAGGVCLSMGLLNRVLGLSDPALGFLCGIAQFSASFLYAFVEKGAWIVWVAPVVDMMNGTMWVVAKAMVSKMVGVQEYGRVFTLFSVLTLLVPFVGDPLYAFVYRATIHTLPGAFFLLSAALTLPPQLIFGVLWARGKGEQQT